MPLYDCGAEDCEECAIAFRGVKLQSPMTCDEIVELIRSKYDPEPPDWPRHRGWDDGAKEIARTILRRKP